MTLKRFLPEEILSAVELSISGEAFRFHGNVADDTTNAFDVPRLIENRQQELIQDGRLASGTDAGHHGDAEVA